LKASPPLHQQRFSDLLTAQCDQLSGILSRYQQGHINAQLIKDILQFSQHIIDISKAFPHQLVAQLQLYRSRYPWSHNVIFNQVIATYLLLARNRWNDTCTQHLLCATVTQFAGTVNQLDKLPDGAKLAEHWPDRKHLTHTNQKLAKALALSGLEVWQEGLTSASQRWHHQPLTPLRLVAKQSSMLQILALGTCLGRLVTRHKQAKQQPLHFSEALKRITRHLPPALYNLMEPVLTSPGLIPPGSFAKLKNEEVLLVLSSNQAGMVGKTFDKHTGAVSGEIQQVSEMKVRQLNAPQPLKNLSVCDTWWDTDWQMHVKDNQIAGKPEEFLRIAAFKIDSPPPTLLAIQQKLQQRDFDTNEITDLILKEPVFAAHIKQTATQSSRENLIIEDVKHGLLMHGFERASSILMEHALSVRIHQNPFPLGETLQQLCVVFKHTMSCLAQETKLLSAEQASCWANFACSGFFTNTNLKSQLSLPQTDTSNAQPCHLFQHASPEQLHSHSTKLATSWAQSPVLTDALQTLADESEFKQRRKPVKQLALMLGCSSILTRHIFFGSPVQTSEQHYLQQAFDELRILHLPMSFIVNEVLARSHCFVPLRR